MNNHCSIGISPLTWTNDDLPELGSENSFWRCIREMARAGFQGCEIGNRFPKNPRLIKEILQSHKLSVAASWFSSYFTDTVVEKEEWTYRAFARHMLFLKAAGATVVNVCECSAAIHQRAEPIFGDKPVLDDHQWRRLASGLNRIGRLARAHGMRVAYHPHLGTVIQDWEEVARLMQMCAPQFVSLLLDTGHTLCAGDSPLALARQFHDRIVHVHLKDVRPRVLARVKAENMSFLDGVKAGLFTVPGDGVIEFKPVVDALRQHNYAGWLLVEAEQDPKVAHPLTYAKKAHDYLVKQGIERIEDIEGNEGIA
jgi:inosose dehydratase